MRMVTVTLLSRNNCPLCEEAAETVRRVQADLTFTFDKREIDADPHLAVAYHDRIPVILINGVERLAGPIDESQLRRAIRRAHGSGPISRILSRFRLRRDRG